MSSNTQANNTRMTATTDGNTNASGAGYQRSEKRKAKGLPKVEITEHDDDEIVHPPSKNNNTQLLSSSSLSSTAASTARKTHSLSSAAHTNLHTSGNDEEDEDDDTIEGKYADGNYRLTAEGTRSLGYIAMGDGNDDDDDDDDDDSGMYEEEEEEEEDEYYDGEDGEEGNDMMDNANEEDTMEDTTTNSTRQKTATTTNSSSASASNVGRKVDVWRGNTDELEEDEELEYDPTAYDMYHRMELEWPCLSFDIVPDRLGPSRTKFPLAGYLVAGSQADTQNSNRLYVMKISNLTRTKPSEGSDSDDDSDAISIDGEDEDHPTKAMDDDPIVDVARIPHAGGINRVRVMHQEPHIVATWAETGKVHLWDIRSILRNLEVHTSNTLNSQFQNVNSTVPLEPVFTYSGHSTEGYGMDWSRTVPGRLVTGDNNGGIYVWDADANKASAAMGGGNTISLSSTSTASSSSSSSSSSSTIGKGSGASAFGDVWKVSSPYKGHEGSVEELQWSPNEDTVFASAGPEYVRIWDTRARSKCMLSVKAAECDINVISWSHRIAYSLASGDDEGGFKVWDLRNFKPDAFASYFTWHRGPVTSIEWAPDDENCLLVASSDNSVTMWDLSLENDDEAELALAHVAGIQVDMPSSHDPDLQDVPPQLLFDHRGQQDNKEAHFHPQLPGVIFSIAADGMNVWKPDVQTVT